MDDHSLFEARYARALNKPSRSEVDAFWKQWASAGAAPLRSVAELRAACSAVGAPRRLLQRLHAHAASVGKLADTHLLCELLPALLWALIEKHLQQTGGQITVEDAGTVRVSMPEKLAADLVAAAHFDTGLRLMRDADTNQRFAGNVLSGERVQPAEVHHRPVDAVHRAALLAAVDGGFGREGLRNRLRHLDEYLADGVPGDDVVRDALDDLRERDALRLMFAVPAGSGAPLGADPALRQRFMRDFAVPTWFHQASSPTLGDDDPRMQLQGALLRWLKTVLDAVEPDVRSDTRPLGGATPTKVFISYAHADNGGESSDDCFKWYDNLVAAHLAQLERDHLIEVWVDRDGIKLGDTWRQEVMDAIEACDIGVLLMSPWFLGSPFVRQHELPRLRQRHAQGMLLIPVLLKRCDWNNHDWLEALQLAGGGAPLQGLAPAARNSVLQGLVDRIRQHCASVE